jgi:hypothetical protein
MQASIREGIYVICKENQIICVIHTVKYMCVAPPRAVVLPQWMVDRVVVQFVFMCYSNDRRSSLTCLQTVDEGLCMMLARC